MFRDCRSIHERLDLDIGQTKPLERDNHKSKQYCTEEENDPALELMNETISHLCTEVVYKYRNDGDSKTIDGNRYWRGGDHDYSSLPKRRFIEIGKYETDARQRQKISKPTACLSHLKFACSKIDYIAFGNYWNSNKMYSRYTKISGEQLQLDCNHRLKRIGQRNR